MTFIVRMLRYLFWILVVSWAVRLLGRLVSQMGSGTARPQPYVDVPNDAASKKLVRDPICGMHVAEKLALPLKRGNETIFFCSVECRVKYLEDRLRIVANA
jgi:YHS domain-containing protein